MFGSLAAQYDVRFRADVGVFKADVAGIRAAAQQGYGGISTEALKAATIQEKYDRALARTKNGSYAANRATLAYRQEMAALSGQAYRTSGALAAEERSLFRLGKGAIAGSGALGRLRSAAVFASSSFLGGFGLAYALKTVIGAAEDEEVALAHLQLALRNSGHSWADYGGQVEAAAAKLEHASGFKRAEINEALAANVRRFGDVAKAIRVTAIAADVARQKNISLADAQMLVQRASFGNTRSARQLGIVYTQTTANLDKLRETTKKTTAEQVAGAKAADLQANRTALLAAIDAKFQGAAAAFLQTTAGKQQLFNAELKDTEAIIGTRLLPAFNHLLGKASDYLGNEKNQARIQRDVNRAVHDGAIVLRLLGHGIQGVSSALKPVVRALGGFEHAAELAFGILLLRKFTVARGGLTGLLGEIRLLGPTAVTAAAQADSALNSIGATATANATRVQALVTQERLAGQFSPLATRVGAYTGGLTSAAAGKGANYRSLLPIASKGVGAASLVTLLSGAGGATGSKLAVAGMLAASGNPELAAGYLALSFNEQLSSKLGVGFTKEDSAKLLQAAAKGQLTVDQLDKFKAVGMPDAVYQVAKGLIKAREGKPGQGPPSRGVDVPSRFAPTTPGTSTKPRPPGYKPSGPAALDLALAEAQASGNEGKIAAAAKAKLAYDINAAAFARHRIDTGKGTPQLVQELENVLADEASQRSTLQSFENKSTSAAAAAARKKAAAKKKLAADLLRHRKAEIVRLEQIPDNLKAAVLLAKNEEEQAAALRRELKAVNDQLATLKKLNAGKDAIEKNRLTAAGIQKRLNDLAKKTASSGGFAALEKEFLDEQQGLYSKFGSNVFTPGTKAAPTTVHEHHYHYERPPSVDKHREMIYASLAAKAAFDG